MAQVDWRQRSTGGQSQGESLRGTSERICFNPPTGWGSGLCCAEVFKGQCPRWPFSKLDKAGLLTERVLPGLGSFLLGPEREQGGEGTRLFRVPVKEAAAELARWTVTASKSKNRNQILIGFLNPQKYT